MSVTSILNDCIDYDLQMAMNQPKYLF